MENKANTIVITFKTKVLGNEHTLQTMTDIVKGGYIRCPLVTTICGVTEKIGEIHHFSSVEMQNGGEYMVKLISSVNEDFLKIFSVMKTKAEPKIKLNLIKQTGLVRNICLVNWYEFFKPRMN